MSDVDAIMRAMREHSARRLQNADDAERMSMLAFQSGNFQKYWHRRGQEAKDRLDEANDELERAANAADADRGSLGEDGGDGSGAGIPSDDRDGPPEPREEELPPPD